MILEILGLSILGGILLNILPCVLPVIPLKILNFVKLSGESWKARVTLASLYSLGIVCSFVVLGGICAAALFFGYYLGFGFQMDFWWFNLAIGLIILYLGLNKAGIW